MIDVDFAHEAKKYEEMLRPFAFRLTKSKEATEDLLQDTFYRALRNKEKFEEDTNIRAWLFTIMRNVFINNYRRRRKSNIITDTTENNYLLNSTKKTDKNSSERIFLAEEIEKAMQLVSKDFTEPFKMYHNGFHYNEIAESLDLPLGTVKSRIFFARKELQSKLCSMGILNSSYNS